MRDAVVRAVEDDWRGPAAQMSQEALAELVDVRQALGPLAASVIQGASEADSQSDRRQSQRIGASTNIT